MPRPGSSLWLRDRRFSSILTPSSSTSSSHHPIGELHRPVRDALVLRRPVPAAHIQRHFGRPRHHHRLVERHRHLDGLVHAVGPIRPRTGRDPPPCSTTGSVVSPVLFRDRSWLFNSVRGVAHQVPDWIRPRLVAQPEAALSVAVTAELSVRKTALPSTRTALTVRVLLPPVTVKSSVDGLEEESSGSP